MAETIESFVEKLRAEGVEAGRVQADRLLAGARGEAEEILAEAKAQAERMVAEARAEAERTVARGREELALAARDALLRLREAVAGALAALLKRRSAETLADKDFLAGLIREVAGKYAAADAAGGGQLEVRVSDQARDDLLARLVNEAADQDGPVGLKGGLQAAGFEYASRGGSVEVTPESVAAVFAEMMVERLRELIKPENLLAAGQG